MMRSKHTLENKKEKPLVISDTDQNTILDTIYAGGIPHIVIKDTLKISLRNFYKYLETNPKFKEEFNKAQEIGIKTLVEKMLAIFDVEDPKLEPADLLFIREKKDFLKWLSPRMSSLFQEKQNLNVKSDSHITYSWTSDNEVDIKTIEAEIENEIPTSMNKD